MALLKTIDCQTLQHTWIDIDILKYHKWYYLKKLSNLMKKDEEES